MHALPQRLLRQVGQQGCRRGRVPNDLLCADAFERDDFGGHGFLVCHHDGLVASVDVGQGLSSGFPIDVPLAEDVLTRG